MKPDRTPEEISRILFKARHPDGCWHDFGEQIGAKDRHGIHFCGHCEEIFSVRPANPNYTLDTPEGWSAYGPFLQWAKEQEWWMGFIRWGKYTSIHFVMQELFTPSIGSALIAAFLVKEGIIKEEGQ